MGKKLLSVTIKGNNKTWSFNFYADTKYIHEWRKDGLVIYEILNVIPVWVVNLGLTKIWCFMQSIFNFNNPFK